MEDEKTAPGAGVTSFALVAATIGMSAASKEGEVHSRVRALADAERDLLRTTGKATLEEALGTVKAWQLGHAQLEVAQAELVSLRKTVSDCELDALIDSAKASGKITSEALEKVCRDVGASSPKQLRALLETMSAVGGGTLKREATTEPEAGAALSESDREMARMLGIPPEDMLTTRRDDIARKAG